MIINKINKVESDILHFDILQIKMLNMPIQ